MVLVTPPGPALFGWPDYGPVGTGLSCPVGVATADG